MSKQDFLQYGFDSKENIKPLMQEFLKLRHMVKYEGNQEVQGKLFPMFTDKRSGSTFIVKKGERLRDVLVALRNNYKE